MWIYIVWLCMHCFSVCLNVLFCHCLMWRINVYIKSRLNLYSTIACLVLSHNTNCRPIVKQFFAQNTKNVLRSWIWCVLTNVVGFITGNEIDFLFTCHPTDVDTDQSPASPAASGMMIFNHFSNYRPLHHVPRRCADRENFGPQSVGSSSRDPRNRRGGKCKT